MSESLSTAGRVLGKIIASFQTVGRALRSSRRVPAAAVLILIRIIKTPYFCRISYQVEPGAGAAAAARGRAGAPESDGPDMYLRRAAEKSAVRDPRARADAAWQQGSVLEPVVRRATASDVPQLSPRRRRRRDDGLGARI